MEADLRKHLEQQVAQGGAAAVAAANLLAKVAAETEKTTQPTAGEGAKAAADAADDASAHAAIVDKHGNPGAKANAHAEAAQAHAEAAKAHQAAAEDHAAKAQTHADTAVSNAGRQTTSKARMAAEKARDAAAKAQLSHSPDAHEHDGADRQAPEDKSVSVLLGTIVSTIEQAITDQGQDPDNLTDPNDAAVWAHLKDALAAIQAAAGAQATDVAEDLPVTKGLEELLRKYHEREDELEKFASE